MTISFNTIQTPIVLKQAQAEGTKNGIRSISDAPQNGLRPQNSLENIAGAMKGVNSANSKASCNSNMGYKQFSDILSSMAFELIAMLQGGKDKITPEIRQVVQDILDNAPVIVQHPDEFIKWFVTNWEKISNGKMRISDFKPTN